MITIAVPEGAADDSLNRVAAIKDDSQVIASYQTLGLDTIVTEHYQQPEVKLDYTGRGDSYSGLTEFNRVQEQIWTEYGATPKTLDQFTYLYDQDGTTTAPMPCIRLSMTDGYNGANEVTSVSGGDNQTWTPDGMGNLGSANTSNQLNLCGYDQDGNMIADGHATTIKYDAWNRLVEVDNSGGHVLAKYQYDGTGRKVMMADATTTPGTLNSYTYSALRRPAGRRDAGSRLPQVRTSLHSLAPITSTYGPPSTSIRRSCATPASPPARQRPLIGPSGFDYLTDNDAVRCL